MIKIIPNFTYLIKKTRFSLLFKNFIIEETEIWSIENFENLLILDFQPNFLGRAICPLLFVPPLLYTFSQFCLNSPLKKPSNLQLFISTVSWYYSIYYNGIPIGRLVLSKFEL
ncbi:hypothetical protein RCL_jg15731.t1 [Rhizophagus clarus]|uniref:Uncharacterized protein n=1 Tax=Rhizophagus clarus TaxID=94130 RepID=A0A8H3R3L5_9GLOM|nr:hypothetical protein RCL_jg15731.t1 [Rhizophagus clarus]